MNQDTKLLNCPCCDGETGTDIQKSNGIMNIRYYANVCKKCGLSTKYYCEASKEKADKDWNTRTTTDHDKLRAQLKAAEDRVIKFEGIAERVRQTNAALVEENRELNKALTA